MTTGLTKKFSLILWQAKRREQTGQRYQVCNVLREFKHYMNQNHKDYGQRSKASRNRNGSNNRSARKHAQQSKIIFSCQFFDLTI
jgi:hypothetical protein